MKLLYAWKDALSLILSATIKLFFLATLKSIKETSRLFLTYCWWLVPLMLIINVLLRIYDGTDAPLQVLLRLSALFYYSVILIIFILARPSICRKDRGYFLRYAAHIIQLSAFLVTMIIAVGLPWGLMFNFCNHTLLLFGSIMYALMFNILFEFSLLFFLDSSLSFSSIVPSIYRGFKMLIYNFPLVLILSGGCLAIGYYIKMLGHAGEMYIISRTANIFIRMSLEMMQWMVVVMSSIIFICLFTNVYVKRLYDQYDLYFPKK